MIEGLGFAFTSNKQERFSIKKWILSKFISTLYKIALKRVTKVLFLNQDDLEFFKNNQLIRPDQAYLLGPIGLNLQDWPQKKYTSVLGRPICFIFVGRLLKEKGLPTLIEAARILKPSIEKGLLKIQVLGAPDENPSAISLEEVKTWHQEGLIEYLGATQNVRPYLDETDVFVLPSYREGFPMSAQEASSVGLPIITTRSVGCKETVKEGKNGFLFEPGDSKSLSRLMKFFIENPSKIEDLGQESRKIAELNYDSKKINDRLIKLFVGDF
jgi:glycosyltransferase involved in cell wall biosynthesis